MGGQATAKLRSQDAEESKGMGGKALCGGETSGAKVLRLCLNCLHGCLLSGVRLFGDPRDCSLLGSSVHVISQARIPKWVATSFSRGPSEPRDQICISSTGGQILYPWTIWETEVFKEQTSTWLEWSEGGTFRG